MRIYWIGKGKPPSVPGSLRHIGGNVYETHDGHFARELGGKEARWSLSQPVAEKLPPANDPNRVLNAERAAAAAKKAKADAASAPVVEEPDEDDEPAGRARDPETGHFVKRDDED